MQKKSNQSDKSSRFAGWPVLREYSFASGIRAQVNAKQNQTFSNHWEAGELFFPSLGKLVFRDAGYILPKTPPSLITITRNAAGQYFASFLCVEKEYRELKGQPEQTSFVLPVDETTNLPKVTSIDMSLRSLAVDQDGKALGRSRYLKRFARKLRHANKSLARKQKGSHRWHKAKIAQGKVHVKTANMRDVELRMHAKELVSKTSILCIEDLVLAFMLRNFNLSSSAHDAALGKFKSYLIQECKKQGKLLLQCGRFDPTSQLCSSCGYKHKELKLKDTTWTCPSCNTTHDRDHNAAINIRVFALQNAIKEMETIGSENDPRKSAFLVEMKYLHPTLQTFMARGGLTALLESCTGSRECRRGSNASGCDKARETRVLAKASLKG